MLHTALSIVLAFLMWSALGIIVTLIAGVAIVTFFMIKRKIQKNKEE